MFERRQGGADGSRDLAIIEAVDVAEDDGDLLIEWKRCHETGKATPEEQTGIAKPLSDFRAGLGRLGALGNCFPRWVEAEEVSVFAAVEGGDEVFGNGEEPRSEGALATERPEPGPGMQPNALPQVAGIVGVVGSCGNELEEGGIVESDQSGKCGAVSICGAPHGVGGVVGPVFLEGSGLLHCFESSPAVLVRLHGLWQKLSIFCEGSGAEGTILPKRGFLASVASVVGRVRLRYARQVPD
jgi:hypothetical protein